MCIGIPMRVVKLENGIAICDAAGAAPREVNMLLVPEAKPGDDVLVHAASAIRVLEPGEADLIAKALSAVELASAGESFDHLLGDLINREPELPEHLRETAKNNNTSDEVQHHGNTSDHTTNRAS